MNLKAGERCALTSRRIGVKRGAAPDLNVLPSSTNSVVRPGSMLDLALSSPCHDAGGHGGSRDEAGTWRCDRAPKPRGVGLHG